MIQQDVLLTSDNPHLSRPKMGDPVTDSKFAIDCKSTVADYLRQSVSENTRRAYKNDLEHFLTWGGSVPCSDDLLATYLADHAGILAIATLTRRLASISKAHAARGSPSPARSALVQSTLRGIKRAHAKPQRLAKPLLVEDLTVILCGMGDTAKDTRDRALLLLGFAGGFRRSELVAINCKDIEPQRKGLVVTIRRSKTDQEGEGRKVGIPFARGRHCPVHSIEAWLELAGIDDGPLFRPVTRHGRIGQARLSGEAVALIVKQRVEEIGLCPAAYSGHSLRSGLATSAAAAGVSSWKIRAQTGHASDAMLSRYIRDGELFVNNAAGVLL